MNGREGKNDPAADREPPLFVTVIPVFNNAGTMEEVLERTLRFSPALLIVDDGSTDMDIPAFCRSREIPFLRHERNLGKGAALLSAADFLLTHCPETGYMLTLDADGQHFPEDIPLFLPLMRQEPHSLLIGVRDFDSRPEQIPASSRFGRNFANFWMRVETGLVLQDCQSGFRAYPLELFREIRCSAAHYDFETEILTRAVWAGLSVRETAIRICYLPAGERVSHFRKGLDNWRISLTHCRLVGRRLLPFPHRKLPSFRERRLRAEEKGKDRTRDAAGISPHHGGEEDITPSLSLLLHPKKLFLHLLKEHATPGGLAASAAAGTLLAVLPIFGFHSIAILYVTARLHLNKIMALTIQHPFMPPLTPVLCIETGYFLRHGSFLTNPDFELLVAQSPERLLEWLIGSLILGPIFALLSGLAVWISARFLQRRFLKHES